MTDKPRTGWIKYHIAGKGGSMKTDHWVFAPDLNGDDKEEVREHIVREYESWAQWAEYYSFEYFTGLLPPVDLIQKRIEGHRRRIGWLQKEIEMLQSQLGAAPVTGSMP